ncbi:hypothetical protein FQZ97_743840 [compost metagenome]
MRNGFFSLPTSPNMKLTNCAGSTEYGVVTSTRSTSTSVPTASAAFTTSRSSITSVSQASKVPPTSDGSAGTARVNTAEAPAL